MSHDPLHTDPAACKEVRPPWCAAKRSVGRALQEEMLLILYSARVTQRTHTCSPVPNRVIPNTKAGGTQPKPTESAEHPERGVQGEMGWPARFRQHPVFELDNCKMMGGGRAGVCIKVAKQGGVVCLQGSNDRSLNVLA